MTGEFQPDKHPTQPAHLPAGSVQIDGQWYYQNNEKRYVPWEGNVKDESGDTSVPQQSQDLVVKGPQGEFSINLSAKGDGLLMVEKTLGSLAQHMGGYEGRTTQATLIYDEKDPAQDPEYIEYMRQLEKMKQQEMKQIESTEEGKDEVPSADLTTTPSQKAETPATDEPEDDIEIDSAESLEAAAQRKSQVADRPSYKTLERQANNRKRLRIAGIMAALVITGSVSTAHAFNVGGREAREACSPAGVAQFVDVVVNAACYADYLGKYTLDLTKFFRWGE